MKNKMYLAAPIFVLAHVALLVAYVPLANLIPATLGALALNCMVMSMVLAARWPWLGLIFLVVAQIKAISYTVG